MGRILVAGPGSTPFLQRVTTNDVAKLAVGQAQYSMACNEQGGIKDDVFVYRTGETEFLLCVNASNRTKILEGITAAHTPADACRIEDRSSALAREARGGTDRDAIRERTIALNQATEHLAEAMMDSALKEALASKRATQILESR